MTDDEKRKAAAKKSAETRAALGPRLGMPKNGAGAKRWGVAPERRGRGERGWMTRVCS